MHEILLRRYSIISGGQPTPPVNVIEKAVDLHTIQVISSSGYQKCINHLWKGWLVQDENDASVFVEYRDKDNPSFFVHMDPDRMRAPMHQNAAQMLLSIIYLILYTAAINSVNPTGRFDATEIAMYIFTLGYICDELLKLYKAGYYILGFWNVFNGLLYSFLMASFILRIMGLTLPNDDGNRSHYSTQSYNLLSFIAPMFWSRLLLYLDSFRFFGAMLVVLKVMMKESVIFFALLIIIIVGFLQAFIGLDLTDDDVAGDVLFIAESMIKAVLQAPEFDGFENFGPPYGIILYYCFTFLVMVRTPYSRAPSWWLMDTDKNRWFFLTSSSPSTTRRMRTFTKTQMKNTWRFFRRRLCSLFARPMKTSTLHPLTWLKFSFRPCWSGGCQRKHTSLSTTASWVSCMPLSCL